MFKWVYKVRCFNFCVSFACLSINGGVGFSLAVDGGDDVRVEGTEELKKPRLMDGKKAQSRVGIHQVPNQHHRIYCRSRNSAVQCVTC